MSNLSEETLLTMAEQQLTGFVMAVQGYSAAQLASEMNLTAGEWEQLKDAPYLTEAVREELQEYIDNLPEKANGDVVSVYISN